jgi:hypothetical protein
MSTIRVVNIQHTDATEPNIVLESDGTATFVSGITISGGTNLTVSGTASFASGTVSAPGISFVEDNNTGIYSPAADELGIATAGTAAIIVDSSQNVGIGTTSPGVLLDAAGSNPTLRVRTTTTNTEVSTIRVTEDNNYVGAYLKYDGSTNLTHIGTHSAADSSTANDNNAITIERDTRNVGIGTSNPLSVFDCVVGASGTRRLLVNYDDSLITIKGSNNSSNPETLRLVADNLRFNTGISGSGSEAARIDSSGRLLIGTTSGTELLEVHGDTPVLKLRDTSDYAVNTGPQIYFQGKDSNELIKNFAIIKGISNGSDNGELSFWTRLSGTQSERLRIKNNGKVGIGTTSPNYELHVNASDTISVLQLTNTSTGTTISDGFLVYQNGLNSIVSNQEAGFLRFETNATPRVEIDSSGNVGIGTTSPSYPLSVKSTTSGGIDILDLDNLSAPSSYGGLRVSLGKTDRECRLTAAYGDSFFTFYNGTTSSEKLRIDAAGRLLVGTSTARANFYNSTNDAKLQVEGIDNNTSALSIVQNFNANTLGARLILGKSNGSAVGSNTIVANGDTIGAVSFQGNDGSEFVEAAKIQAEVDGTPGANDMPGRLTFWTSTDGASSPTERMRILSAGAVAINSTTTGVANAGSIVLDPNSNGTNQPFVGCGGDTSSDIDITWGAYSTSLSQYQFYVGYGGTVFARSTSISGLSDEREKKNIRDLDTGLAQILQLQPRRFDWKNGSGQDLAGFVAQEVETVLPELVDEYKLTETETRKALKMGDLVPTLVKALQETHAKIEALEQRLSDAGIA